MKLYNHQLNALSRLSNGCILNGGTGSGKSLTAVAYYYMLNGGDRSTLTSDHHYTPLSQTPIDLYIITTARKRDEHDWDKELGKFMMSSFPNGNIYSNKVVVDSWNNIEKYKTIRNAFFIFDEQRVVGTGKWARSFIQIAHNNKWLLLSATPGDKWEDYRAVFIANRFYKNKTQFDTEHIVYDYRPGFPRVVGYRNTERLIRLRDKILIDMDFERKTMQHHKLVKTDYDRDTYAFVQKHRKNPDVFGYIPSSKESKNALCVGVDIAIASVTPIMDGWDYIPKNGDYVRFDYKPIESPGEFCYILRKIVNRDTSKFNQLRLITDQHKRSIIFYKFDYELTDLHSIYSDYKEDEIGEWNGHKHQPVPTGKRWVYFVQYTAGCEGWNCITTDTIIFFSEDYSYKVMIQACGRIDRLNTPFRDLYYYHFISKSPIDAAIIRALKAKKNFNEGHYARAIGECLDQ